jgi:hypothetical protein
MSFFRKKCKIENCNNYVWSKGLCKNHSNANCITPSSIDKTKKKVNLMHSFFADIWKERKHFSEISNVYLGKEPLSIYFHHILPKNKYPEAAYDKDNIILLTLDEHTNVENDIYKYDKINEIRKKLLDKYQI